MVVILCARERQECLPLSSEISNGRFTTPRGSCGYMKIKLVPYSDIDRGSPIQISPFKLGNFIESEFDSKDWKYVNDIQIDN